MKKQFMAAVLTGAMVMAPVAAVQAEETAPKAKEDIKIGLSWKTLQEERWVRELKVMEDACAEMGIEFVYQVSENDAMKQVTQIENMVSQGIDILIWQSNEKETVANALQEAAEAGVLVCSYEATQGESYANLSGGNDEYEIGQLITKTIADTGITGKVAYLYGDPAGGAGVYKFHDGMHLSMEDCDVEIVGEQWVTNWDPATGMGYAENWIAQYGEELQAILCMNDGLAGGVIQALENAGLAGDVLVCGQDCELLALQRIVAGTQISTVLKSGNEYPLQFLNTCIDYYLGDLTIEDFDQTETNNAGEEIPYFKYDGLIITADNIDDVIEAGVYTHEDIYGE